MKRPGRSTFFAAILIIAVLSSVIVGIVLLGPPSEWRLRQLDERRVSDLRELSYAIDDYWAREGTIPTSLEELASEERIVGELADPETGEPYEYRALGDTTYELCAVFALDRAIDDRDYLYRSLWFHEAGRQCFQLEARDTGRVIDR